MSSFRAPNLVGSPRRTRARTPKSNNSTTVILPVCKTLGLARMFGRLELLPAKPSPRAISRHRTPPKRSALKRESKYTTPVLGIQYLAPEDFAPAPLACEVDLDMDSDSDREDGEGVVQVLRFDLPAESPKVALDGDVVTEEDEEMEEPSWMELIRVLKTYDIVMNVMRLTRNASTHM
ncbi:hypothetical protein FB45DRAFT_1149037 [Roridomyces roridus]|uniref:Uncharacterized protein n=1 Tax=Roridomyces roridus TaxID=1738132 RepID=A0AAD7F9E0_9AGAR|nr:hypothetical protein FB45DRAFT_1149037 [Roridomyces roridus]